MFCCVLLWLRGRLRGTFWSGHDWPDYGTLTAQQDGGAVRDYGSSGPNCAPADEVAVGNEKSSIPPVVWLLRSPRLLVALLTTMVFEVMLSTFDAALPLFV